LSDLLASITPLDQEGPPEIVEIEPIHTCNLRCTMCHVSYSKMSKRRLRIDFIERLDGLQGKWAKVGSQYEPTAHPQFAQIVNGLTEKGFKIDLTTNGTLFTDKLIGCVAKANFQNVTVSFDGATAETYERVRRRGHFQQAIERILAFMNTVKARNPEAYFSLNYTFMMSNVAEAADAAAMWDGYGFDHIGFISMTIPDARRARGALAHESPQRDLALVRACMKDVVRRITENKLRITASSPWFHDQEVVAEFPDSVGAFGGGLAGSDHPHKRWPRNPVPHFQNGYFPAVHVECRSPYKLVRIEYDGAVRLCNAITIGSIYDADLRSIWEGAAAKAFRSRIAASARICHTCDYYRFCVKANDVDYDDASVFAKQRRLKNIIATVPILGPAVLRTVQALRLRGVLPP
jgi:radical SAM protein with 4Fe4S-binding SPASM domain